MEEQRKLLNLKWGKRLHYDYVILTAGPNYYILEVKLHLWGKKLKRNVHP
jgi:hypothetical protein